MNTKIDTWAELAATASASFMAETDTPNWKSAIARMEMENQCPEDTDPIAWSVAVDEAIASAAAGLPVPLPSAEGPDSIWTKRPSLALIKRHANARIISPWGLLGGTLSRVLTSLPFWVNYETDFMGEAPINAIHINVGKSGSGKSYTQSALNKMLHFQDPAFAVFPTSLTPGSGEGLEEAYLAEVPVIEDGKPAKNADGSAKTDLQWCNDYHSIHWYFDEIGKLNTTGRGRQGSTLFENVKSAGTGGSLGRVLAGRKGVTLPAGSYRFVMDISAQPERCATILSADETAGGFPQRVVWFDMEQKNPHLYGEAVRDLPPLIVPAQHWAAGHTFLATPYLESLHVAHAAGEAEALDGHALMARAKIAVALAVMDGRQELNDEDVEIAGLIMEHSRQTLASVQKAIASAGVAEARAEGKRRAVIDGAATESKDDILLRRAQKKIVQWTAKGLSETDVRQKLNRRNGESALWLPAMEGLQVDPILLEEISGELVVDGVLTDTEATTVRKAFTAIDGRTQDEKNSARLRQMQKDIATWIVEGMSAYAIQEKIAAFPLPQSRLYKLALKGLDANEALMHELLAEARS